MTAKPESQIVQNTVHINALSVANNRPFTLFGGLNVLEDEALAIDVAGQFSAVCQQFGIPYVFKASFDKANRSSVNSYRGPGIDRGLKILSEVKRQLSVPVITDVHEAGQASETAAVVDVLQLPAFLSRQTDLVTAMASTGAVINIKKAQFLAPEEMRHILQKFREAGNDQLMLCERGSCFGYNNLVVDMLGFGVMKNQGVPVIFDVTHALQKPGGLASSADGRRQQVVQLGLAGMSQGLAGLFLEAHPDPDKAKCDGPCALPLSQLEAFLMQMKKMDDLVKQLPMLDIQ